MKIVLLLILPLFISAQPIDESVSYLSNYILSEDFEKMSNGNNDLIVIDSLYLTALKYHNGDISEGLLTIAFATLAFQELPVQVPIINFKIYLPLSHVDEKKFHEKVETLPKNIFFNSPKTKFGDKDKLAHFFGSAYLSHSFTIFNLSKFMGIFIELFEATFKVEGFLDYRDLVVNELGELYGNALIRNPDLLPSDILKIYNLLFFRVTN